MSRLSSLSFTNAAGTTAKSAGLDLSDRGVGPFISMGTGLGVAASLRSKIRGKFAGAVDFAGRAIRGARKEVVLATDAVVLADQHKGTVVQITKATAAGVTLPNNWEVGDWVIVRQVGAGACAWTLASGATAALPTARSTHTKLTSQHSEAEFRVVANADGATAVWAINGDTSA